MYYVVFITAPDMEVAKVIAKELVAKKIAACVNLVPKITSIYWWDGQLQEDSEVLMIAKTKKSSFAKLKKEVQKLHPYEVPEIIALPLDEGSEAYLEWIEKVVKF